MKRLLIFWFLAPLATLSQEAPLWQVGGSASASVNVYAADGIANRREPFRYNVSLNPIFKKANWYIPVELTLYNLGIGSDYRFARMGIHPAWKWGRLHAGHTNLRVSSFSLSGRTLFGAGAELNPGLLRFAVLWGSTRQSPSSALTNAAQANAFAQEVLTVKMGIGNAKHFADLILLKGRDDPSSLDSARLTLDQYPEENTVIALRTEHYFWDGRWFTGGEFALSGLTQNQGSRPLEEVAPDAGVIPNWLFDARVASLLANAGEAFLGYRGNQFHAKLAYQRISPGFRSFGSYFFQDDIESLDLLLEVKLLKNKLRIKTRGGLRHNNLAGDKTFENNRARGSVQIYYRPALRWTVTGHYSNYQTEQRLQDIAQRDSLRTALVSENFNLNVQHVFTSDNRSRHVLGFGGGLLSSSDRFQNTNASPETKNYLANILYQLSTFSGKWQWQAGLDYLGFSLGNTETNRYGSRLGATRSWKGGRWRASVSSQQVWSYRDGSLFSISFMPAFQLAFRPGLWDFFQIQLQHSNQNFRSGTSADFSEWQAMLRYNHRFGKKKRKS